MAQQRSPFTPKTAYVVHFVLIMTITATAAVCWVVGDAVSIGVGPVVSRAIRYAAVAELVVTGAIIAHLRSKIPLIAPADDVADWWAANGTRVMVTWALAYGAGMTGAALWLVTDDVLILAAVVVAAILLLMRLAPTRWRVDEPAHKSKLVP